MYVIMPSYNAHHHNKVEQTAVRPDLAAFSGNRKTKLPPQEDA